MTSVSLPTIKRLFAVSSNCCAFPNCSILLTEPNVTKGKVCHIKGANSTGARYDASQTEADRHHFDNLILLCANHHDVIDDDVEAYTVERLRKMKADHEGRATTISDELAETSATLLMMNSVASFNQSGGITAHTLNFHLPPTATNPRTADAINNIWESMLRLRKEFSDIILAEGLLATHEIEKYFKADSWEGMFSSILNYRIFEAVQVQMTRAGVNDMDALEIHVPPKMWTAFYSHRALIGRLGFLYHLSSEQRLYKNWRTDSLFFNAARGVADQTQIQTAIEATVGGAGLLITAAEQKFKAIAAQHSS